MRSSMGTKPSLPSSVAAAMKSRIGLFGGAVVPGGERSRPRGRRGVLGGDRRRRPQAPSDPGSRGGDDSTENRATAQHEITGRASVPLRVFVQPIRRSFRTRCDVTDCADNAEPCQRRSSRAGAMPLEDTHREQIVLPCFYSDHGTRRRRAHDPKRIISRGSDVKTVVDGIRSGSSANQTQLAGALHGRASPGDAELLGDVGDVVLDRDRRDEELLADFVVRQPPRKEAASRPAPAR